MPVRDLVRADIERFLDAEKPLRTRNQRAMMAAFLHLASGPDAPLVDAEGLREELGRRWGGALRPAAFRQQLARLNRALDSAKAPFSLAMRSGRVAAEASSHWNSASQMDSVRQALVEHSGAKTRGDLEGYVPPRAMPDRLLVMWSYAWLSQEQQAIQLEIFELLKAKLAHPAPKYRHLPQIELWRDEERIALAEAGTPQMDEACTGAFLGLLVLSDKYPASRACLREADHFLDEEGDNRPDKGCIVLRFNCAIEDMDPRFCKRIVFPAGGEGHLLNQWVKGDADDRNRLVGEIAKQVFEHANGRYRQPALGPAGEFDRHHGKSRMELFVAEQSQRMRHDDAHSTTPLARAGADGYDVANSQGSPDMGGVDIVERLIDWAASSDASRPRVTALLGDFGMGKTVTCQLVCRRMVERSEVSKGLPTPVYFDLRDIPRPDRPEHVTLESLMADLLRRTGETAPSANEVIEFIRRRKALVIFDGLDEITNKYSIDVARIIYRQLISIVPSEVWNDDARRRRRANQNGAAADGPREGPSILLSCRSQYFADFAAERGFLSDSDRSGLKLHEDISVYVMLPFNADQIRDYIARNLPAGEYERAMSLIESTYDLGELARRPILLRYISELVDRLETEKLAGKTINLSRLYDILVSQTFERDGGKHVIPIADKKRLLQALALHLHRRQSEDISNEKLVEWLDGEIAANFPKLAAALQGEEGLKLSEVFVQDLRNATLLSRPGESGFRFGHTSLREFFLGGALYRAVLDGRGSATWDMELPSHETLDFLLQRHAAEEGPERRRFEREFAKLMEEGQPLATRTLAFRVWREAFSKGPRLPRPAQIDCSGLHLPETWFEGVNGEPLPLHDSLWNGALLDQASFVRADLSNADFTEVSAVAARFISCSLRMANFRGSHLGGSIWRDCDLGNGALDGCNLVLAKAHRSTLAGKPWRPQRAIGEDAGGWQLIRRAKNFNIPCFGSLEGRAVMAVREGRTIAISDLETGTRLRNIGPDARRFSMLSFATLRGDQIVLAAGAAGIRVWDASSGRLIATVEVSGVSELGFSRSERSALIGWFDNNDGAVVLWDLESVRQVHKIRYEADEARGRCLILIEDRAMIAEAMPAEVRLRDLASGELIRSLPKSGDVRSLMAGVLGGETVLTGTAAHDGTIRTWSVASGKELLASSYEERVPHQSNVVTVEGVGAVTIAPAFDQLRLLHAETGAPLRRFVSRGGTFTPAACGRLGEGLVIASGAGKTVKLWLARSGALLRTFAGHSDRLQAVAFAQFEEAPTIASSADDGKICLWNADTGLLVREWIADQEGVNAVGFADVDGQRFILSGGDDGKAYLWDSYSKDPVRAFRRESEGNFGGDWIMAVASTTHDGRPLVLGAGLDHHIHVWDARTGETVRVLEGHKNWIRSLAVHSEEGGALTIVSASDEGTIGIWDGLQGRLLRRLQHHDGAVTAVALGILDGCRIIASGGVDARLCLSDLDTGKLIREYHSYADWVNAVSFVEDGGRTHLLSGHYSTDVNLRELSNGETFEWMALIHDAERPVKMRHRPKLGASIISAHEEAWIDFQSSYSTDGGGFIAEIDDMPEAAA